MELYRNGMLHKNEVFSIFDERTLEETVALFDFLYSAKDFETFFKSASWARVHLNEYQFIYTYYIAVISHPNTQNMAIPAPYEIYPELFTNSETMFKAFRVKMQGGLLDEKLASYHGIVKENNNYIFYANYSSYWTYGPEEQKLAYFTEDIGLNSHYYFFHCFIPFWKNTKVNNFKERLGEFWLFHYQQLLARYYLERLSNGLGEISDFSWEKPIKTKYTPFMSTLHYPFIQRSGEYYIPVEKYNEEIQLLDTYEKTFLEYLELEKFKSPDGVIDFRQTESTNFVGYYWQSNPNLYSQTEPRKFLKSYENIARHLLSAVPESFEKRTDLPSALNFYQTSLRDPIFYQLYGKILKYSMLSKKYLYRYTKRILGFDDVKINDVQVDKLVTFFDFFEYEITNRVFRSYNEIKNGSERYLVRQPRLNHKPFTVTIDVTSKYAGKAVVKIFLGPKYDSKGFPITLQDNWMNFVELEWFSHNLTVGQNKIERNSKDFSNYKGDPLPTSEIYKYLRQRKLPVEMSEDFDCIPDRMMLPKGTEGGFPYQLVVYVYRYRYDSKAKGILVDGKPFGYPFDRPVWDETRFSVPNMFSKDVFIYFEGNRFPYQMNVLEH
ncbi:arylphorin subunit beta-like [Pectinophora gossypiella]|uniref:arylphorin subunit beta-like n=1 Tax=Pectinophora gossypiella TaxID=13191 RepID=UPI00214E0DCA|nr:arylphorin subunit beta-like [Pectinophora gossypiella]